jgi:TonB family protein
MDAVNQAIQRREALDRGFSRGLLLSVCGHLLIAGIAVAAPLLLPRKPILRVVQGQIIPLPPGGGGTPNVQEPARAAEPEPPAPPQPPVSEPEPPPKVKKPPKETSPPSKGVAPLDSKKKPQRRSAAPTAGSGAASQAPGLEFLPAGPGAPGGTDLYGDWYLASVQRKIWMLWNQQIRGGPQLAVRVRFTILADGAVEDVQVISPSGVYLLDQAAQRAIYSAAPFGPLPKHYGTNRYTILANFTPTA